MSQNIENEGPGRLPPDESGPAGEPPHRDEDGLRPNETRPPYDPTLVEDIREIGRKCAANLGPGPSSEEIADFLYDEHGLPK